MPNVPPSLSSKPSNNPVTPTSTVPLPLAGGQADLYCCGDRRGLLLPLLLTCSTVLLTSSWPTCSMPLAELVLIMVGLFSSGKLLSASAACNRKRRRLEARRTRDREPCGRGNVAARENGTTERRRFSAPASLPGTGLDPYLVTCIKCSVTES